MNTSFAPFKCGGFTTLGKSLQYAAKSSRGLRFFDDVGHAFCQASYAQLYDDALKLASYLQTLKLPRGSYVGLVAQTRLEFHVVFFACQYAGLVPCPLPYAILPTGREAYELKLTQLLKVVKPKLLITPEHIIPIVQNVTKQSEILVQTYEALRVTIESLNALPESQYTPLNEDELAYIQFSSGSTAQPTGLLITQKMIMSNLNAIARDGMQVIENERILSWLPYDHDMGLVSFVLSVINTQSAVDYISPTTFMRHPDLWLKLMSELRSTMTFAPVFAYRLAMEKIEPSQQLDLSTLRVAGIGGDMIHATTLHEFAHHMRDTGFKFEAFCTGYGLAEATLTVTLSPPNKPPLIKKFSDVDHTQELVSCGRALPEINIKIVNANESLSTQQAVGEVWIKGPSIVHESLNASEKLIFDDEGFLFTGDLGFLYDDHLFITGRVKDIIIVRGRNIWTQDIEWVAKACDKNIEDNKLAAFSIIESEEEQPILLIEDYLFDAALRINVHKCIIESINRTFGIKIQVEWIDKDQLTTTAVGKLARSTIKSNYINGLIKTINN